MKLNLIPVKSGLIFNFLMIYYTFLWGWQREDEKLLKNDVEMQLGNDDANHPWTK